MSYIPADPAFYERILAALDKHPFAATLVTIVIVVGIVSWAWQRRGARYSTSRRTHQACA